MRVFLIIWGVVMIIALIVALIDIEETAHIQSPQNIQPSPQPPIIQQVPAVSNGNGLMEAILLHHVLNSTHAPAPIIQNKTIVMRPKTVIVRPRPSYSYRPLYRSYTRR